MKKSVFSLLFTIAAVSILGCGLPIIGSSSSAKAGGLKDNLSNETRRELAQARAATAKYHDISQALADGYVDIDVFVPSMGFHYLRPGLLDATFSPDKPELLVYAVHPAKNRLRLVAVEYAVPIALSPEPPEGFTGDQDVWDRNEEFDLWTLHAWVWLENPNGMFADLNPRVP